MGASSDQLDQQIADVRGSMESKVIELRERSRATVRRSARTAVLVVGAAAAIGAALGAGYVIYRMTRPATIGERFERVVPAGWWANLKHLRESLELGIRKQVPPLRLYIGDRQVGEEPPSSSFEKIAVKAAQAAGTAAAAAVVSRLVSILRGQEKKPAA